MRQKSYFPESLQELKERLRQLDSVEMLRPDDLILLELKQTLRGKIAKAEAIGSDRSRNLVAAD